MKNEIDAEFTDINKESKYKVYVIVAILYVIVIILSILLVIGIKNQKDIVENNVNENIKPDTGYLNNETKVKGLD